MPERCRTFFCGGREVVNRLKPIIENQLLGEERALFGLSGAVVSNCRFEGEADGESALKETQDLRVERCLFRLRYPLWHTSQTVVCECEMTDTCRAALWYDNTVTLDHCKLHGIKALRESQNITLCDCDIRSSEFGWKCTRLRVGRCTVDSEYPFFECRDLEADQIQLHGKYSFQYVENATIHDSELITKDAFWHSKNVTVTDSVVMGEYLGWYSENLHLIRCKIIGTQPLCYCKGLVLDHCVMEGADLAFENSELHATVLGSIESVKNPLCGSIHAEKIGEIILDAKRTPVTECEISEDMREPV